MKKKDSIVYLNQCIEKIETMSDEELNSINFTLCISERDNQHANLSFPTSLTMQMQWMQEAAERAANEEHGFELCVYKLKWWQKYIPFIKKFVKPVRVYEGCKDNKYKGKIKLLLILALLFVSSCGWFNRQVATYSNYANICIDGVLYYQFQSGASVAYTRDGKIKMCEEK